VVKKCVITKIKLRLNKPDVYKIDLPYNPMSSNDLFSETNCTLDFNEVGKAIFKNIFQLFSLNNI